MGQIYEYIKIDLVAGFAFVFEILLKARLKI